FPGATVAFTIGVQAVIPVDYQWWLNGTKLPGATSSALILDNVGADQEGTYSVVYSDAFETVTNNATLAIISVAEWGDMGQQSLRTGLTNLVAIASGDFHGLALRADGTVTGWGMNTAGAATAPLDLSNVIAIAAGNDSSLALKSDGTVVAWGANSYG